jgi:hypothetical protein
MTDSVVVPFPGTTLPEPEPEVPAPDLHLDSFREDDCPHVSNLIEKIGWAETEEEVHLLIAEVKATVAAWPS